MVSIVRQTWEERFNMYMKRTKKELASMLAENAKYLSPDSCAEFAPKETDNGTSYSVSTYSGNVAESDDKQQHYFFD